jgi:hypothetical protein
MVLQLGGCGRVGDCRNNFCGEGPVRGGRGPFLYSWVLFYSWVLCDRWILFEAEESANSLGAGDDDLIIRVLVVGGEENQLMFGPRRTILADEASMAIGGVAELLRHPPTGICQGE